MSWVTIDFETANERRGSPCAVAMHAVEHGSVASHERFNIRPPDFRFSRFNVALHGITADMCVDALPWPDALRRILRFADGRPLVAHNASFDTGVIRDACDLLGMPWPHVEYACTLIVARRTWPGLVSYSLPYVAASCSAAAWEHHDPAGDSLATAQVGLAAMRHHNASSLNELIATVGATLGRIDSEYWRGCRSTDHVGHSLPQPAADAAFDAASPLYDKTVVFTGELAIVRREAQQLVVNVGGHVARGVSRTTDILVTGYQDLTRLAAHESRSDKYRKAEALIAKGRPIDIISERDFYRLLRSANADEGTRARGAHYAPESMPG